MEVSSENKVEQEKPEVEMSREDRVLAAVAKLNAAEKGEEKPVEPSKVVEGAEAKTEPEAPKEAEPTTVDAGLEKTWDNVLKVDAEARDLRKENKALKELVDKYKDYDAQLANAKEAIDFIEKLKKDPIAVLAQLDVDYDIVKARKNNGGKKTVEERLEQVETMAQKIERERLENERLEAIQEFKDAANGLIPEHAKEKVTSDDVYSVLELHFQATGDIMEVEDAVAATLSAKGVSKAAPKKEAPAPTPEPKKTSSDEPTPIQTLPSNLGSAAPEDATDETTDRDLLLQRALKKIGALSK